MSMVPQPHRPVDLIMQGASSLGGGIASAWQAGRDKAEGDQPIPDVLQRYVQRILAGEDPQQVGAEAQRDPGIAALIQQHRRSPQMPNPASTVPDVGWQGGPALGAPGQFSPSGGPMGPSGPGALGTQAAQGGPAMSLGSMQAQQHQGAQQAIAPESYQPGWMETSRTPPSIAAMAQPTQGAPQVTPQQAGASVGQPSRPAQAAQPAQRNMSRKEFGMLSPILPAAIAAGGRQEQARAVAEGRMRTEQMRAQKDTLLAIMKENGLDARVGQQLLLKLEGMDDAQQRAYLEAMTDLLKAQTQASASTGAARIRADTARGPNPTLEDLKLVQNQIRQWQSITDWQKQPTVVAKVKEAEEQVRRLRQALGIPQEGSGTQQPAPQNKQTPRGKTLRFRFPNGNTVAVPEQDAEEAKRAGGVLVGGE